MTPEALQRIAYLETEIEHWIKELNSLKKRFKSSQFSMLKTMSNQMSEVAELKRLGRII